MGENHFGKNPVALYGGILFMAAISYFVLQKVIETSMSYSNTKIKYAMKKHSYKGIFSLVMYFLSVPLAYINPMISLFIFYGLAIVWLIPDRNIEKAID